MTPHKSIACDPRLLQRSLDDSLSEREEEALATHLTDCIDCQRSLEQLAAQPPRWQQIGQALRDESASGLWTTDNPPGGALTDATLEYEPRDYVASPLDFAVDFLAPPGSAAAIGRLGDIDILQVIGHGGMGIVLKGFQPALNRPVAVKVLAPHLATSGAARQRFAREAQAAAAIVHANVMPIFTVDASGKLPYLVMPFIDGESLQQRIDRQGALDVVDTLRIGLQVARGLAAAHAQGLVHRDIKPANILLERGVDRVLLTDFGLARAADDASLTRSGFIAGTPQFMSPEQARGDAVDSRSDLFSLGSVMYTMLTGRPPFRAESSYGILRRITDNDPRPIADTQPSVPAWLASLVDRLLAKRAEERIESADRVAELIERCLAHLQQPTLAAVPPELVRRRVRPFPLLAALVAAVALLLSAAAYWSWPTGTVPTSQESSIEQTSEASPPAPLPEWDDALPQQIEQLHEDVEDLQQRVDDSWSP
jgi:serine/threonine-protein kinase